MSSRGAPELRRGLFPCSAVCREVPQGPSLRGRRGIWENHDLVALLDQILEQEPGWEEFREDLAYLSDFAVTFRCPGESADRDSALDAQTRCRAFRGAARRSLGLVA